MISVLWPQQMNLKTCPIMNNKHLASTALAGAFAAAILLPYSANAYVFGPYTPDAYTLHLWQMDESATPVADAGSNPIALINLANGATLANSSRSGFGSALSTFDGGQSGITAAGKDALLSPRPLVNGTGDNVAMAYAGASGAFSYEAIIRVDFDPALNMAATPTGNGRLDQMQIFSGEDEANAGRIFQFRVDPVGTVGGNTVPRLHFINLNNGTSVQDIAFDIPTTGPNAIVSNQWYHVAVVYDGNEGAVDNITLYWTWLDQDPSPTAANPIGSSSMTVDLRTGATDFCIGNEGRSTGGSSQNFVGLIDEVRMSGIARAANAMQLIDPNPVVLTEPVGDTLAVGQPASLSVTTMGVPPFAYQWRLGGLPIDGATQSVYAITAALMADSGDYDVVITNNFNAVTSSIATLTVRVPVNLTWVGFADWDIANINWDTNADTVADVAYGQGDNVLFDGQGSSYVYLAHELHPSSVVVNSATDYTFSTFTGGGITRNTGLTKSGAGTLFLDTANSYTGPTVIQAGVLQVGTGAATGSLGTGPVTNQGGLVFATTAGGTISYITGTGGLTNTAAGTVRLSGTNTLSGALSVLAGTVNLGNPDAAGQFTNILVQAPGVANAHSTLVLNGSTYPSTTPLALVGTTGVNFQNESRSLLSSSGTNIINGPLTLGGSGSVQISTSGRNEFNGPISGPDMIGKFTFRGGGTNVVNGQVSNLAAYSLSTVDGGQVTLINSTGNSWAGSEVIGGSTMRFGTANAFPATAWLDLTATFDLAGFNQQVGSLVGTNTTPGVVNPMLPSGIIASSGSTDCVFTLNTSNDTFHTADFPVNNWQIYAGVIRDSVLSGSGKVGFTLIGGGSLTLTNISTYTGDTIIGSGCTLALSNAASIANSAHIMVESGGNLDVTYRSGATITIASAQTLKGNGSFNVVGGLINDGTIELKLNKAGATLSSDRLQGLSQLTYGGTLRLDISGDPLTTSDSFKLFDAASYGGAFTMIEPPVPAWGLAWDTSTLASDGTLRIAPGPDTNPTNITTTVVSGGTALQVSWPASHTGWALQAQTNAPGAGIGTNWTTVPGSRATNQLLLPIDPANGSVFYRLVYP